ncbi:ribulose-phosphate 3-epimerase [Thermoanaerobacteraceae bacterium SP2]|jgi:ribulose-phosphate 3-epimerase|nr:ribulose-phosphate 3-epimerase [Thermoanaerobacteraceae bacterium SP2]
MVLTKVSASILACNTLYLGDNVVKIAQAGADIIHVDIMDGHYVNNLSFGPNTVRDLRQIISLPIEVHLELYNPEKFISDFAKAGADVITVQLDCCVHPIRIFNTIKNHGKKVGLAINPCMDINQIKYFVKYIDYLLLMSVEPGFGGQDFEETTLQKVKEAKSLLKRLGINLPIGVDGGVNLQNYELIKKAGVDILVIGSALFSETDLTDTISKFKGMVANYNCRRQKFGCSLET